MGQLTFGEKALIFLKTVNPPRSLLPGIKSIHPFRAQEVQRYVEGFFRKYYSDKKNRVFVFGINPGRFGSGVTGIPFTDPVALADFCGIRNDLKKRRELSSDFVYKCIERWGGTDAFYEKFFLTAVSPIGFIRNGTNYNYYDSPLLFSRLKPFLVNAIQSQLAFGARRDVAILLGAGKNKIFFDKLNSEHGFFRKVYAIEHPRFVMQYHRKHITHYLKKYQEVFSLALR